MTVLTGTDLKPTSGHIKLWKGTPALSISTDIGFNIVSVSEYIGSARIVISTLYQVADLILLQPHLLLRDTLQKIKQATDITSTARLHLRQRSARQQF